MLCMSFKLFWGWKLRNRKTRIFLRRKYCSTWLISSLSSPSTNSREKLINTHIEYLFVLYYSIDFILGTIEKHPEYNVTRFNRWNEQISFSCMSFCVSRSPFKSTFHSHIFAYQTLQKILMSILPIST